ncbi:MAG: CapA family protein [Gammaproteobacteria bacterium]|nr:MAG: CapA family protein [Gammaproteobacteria bacterium]RLA32686.1 MAG: CapA family protein [Gammaproteobacteria bacterium]
MNWSSFVMSVVLTSGLALAEQSIAQHRTADESFTMALTGDSIITRKLSVYDEPEFLQMIDLIRSADMAFTNLEMLFHNYEPYPMAESGGTWMRGDPELAKELAWAGIDMVSRANNHTGDYGALGMRLTSKYVEEAGIVHAGVGNSLAEAREAKFLETAKARVALISISSSFANHMRAGRSRDDMPPRPGLNPLRYKTTYVLQEADFESVRQSGESLGQFTNQDGEPTGVDEETPGEMKIFGKNFAVGDDAIIRLDVNEDDVREISAVVSNASRVADFTIVTIHAHEHGGRRDIPADFLPVFARAMIEAGADVFVGHGPHALRGIEIFQGKPIFYSLGDFMFQNETLLRLPADNYDAFDLDNEAHVADFNDVRYKDDTTGFPVIPDIWESVIAVPTFNDRQLTELKLYPISLGFGAPRQVRGRPLFADEDLGAKIISDLKELSEPYGTEIEMRRGIGYVILPTDD